MVTLTMTMMTDDCGDGFGGGHNDGDDFGDSDDGDNN